MLVFIPRHLLIGSINWFDVYLKSSKGSLDFIVYIRCKYVFVNLGYKYVY